MAVAFPGSRPSPVVEGEVDETAITHPQIRIRVDRWKDTPTPSDPGDECLTDVAIKIRDLAAVFNGSFVAPEGWVVEMTRPGVSTGHGRHALQHVLLSRPGRRRVIIATVDVAGGQAELRRHEDASLQHRERTGLSLPMRATEYRAVIDQVAELLARAGLEVAIRPTRPPARRARESTGRSSFARMVIACALIGAAVALVLLFR